MHFYIKTSIQIQQKYNLRIAYKFYIHRMQSESVENSSNTPEYYEVQQILKKNYNGNRYLIKWKGWDDPKDYTWQPIQHLTQVMHMVDEFNQKEAEAAAPKRLAKANQAQKTIQQQKAKKKIEKEEEIEQDSSPSSQVEKKASPKVEQKVEKKAKPKQEGFYPKIVNNTFGHQKLHTNERKKTNQQIYADTNQNLKDQLSKYMIPVDKPAKVLEGTQNKQKDKQKWYNQQPYRLRSIFRHVLDKDKLSYICNVQQDNDLACIASVQLENIDKEMEKKYILDLLFNMSQEKIRKTMQAYDQFESSWKI